MPPLPPLHMIRAWCAAAASPRRASSTSFERRVEARVQDEAREEATVRRRAREGMAAPGATGLPTAWKRTESPVPPRRCRCRRDARRCHWPGSGSASSKGTTAGSTSRGRRACGPRSLSAAITTAHVPTLVRGAGWTVFHLPSTPGL